MDGDEQVPAKPARDRCYLPTRASDVYIDVNGMASCMPDPPTPLQLLMKHPKEFLVRLQGLSPGATVTVEARTELGTAGYAFYPEGWGPWRPIVTGRAWTGQVLRLARPDVLGDAKYRVELLVQARDAEGALLGERLFAIVWALNC
jgi:hypothetical protein